MKKKSFFENMKNIFNEQEKKIVSDKKKQFTFFVLGFAFFYILLSSIFLPFEDSAKLFTGENAEFLIGLQGIETSESGFYELEEGAMEKNVYSFYIGEIQIVISMLCTGVFEIIILVSAILASFGITWKKKIVGVIIGIVSGIVFNTLRVWITINIILTQSPEVIEFTHDILFRITLFLYIMIVYVLWFLWANDQLEIKSLKKIIKNKK